VRYGSEKSPNRFAFANAALQGDIPDMLCTKRPAVRNKIDLSDATQVRAWNRRLGISAANLRKVVEKVGNSLSAVTKEVELERTPPDTLSEAGSEQPSVHS
jgi:Protein of unknown function (DUF3606)